MAYRWRESDKHVVYNLRQAHDARIAAYTDLEIAEAWDNFSLSEDYPNEQKFFDYLSTKN